jgi:hypothetical protein
MIPRRTDRSHHWRIRLRNGRQTVRDTVERYHLLLDLVLDGLYWSDVY